MKFKNIELLRFLFALSIICVHIKGILGKFSGEINLYKDLLENFKYAHIPVDFFFIIAGFFLFLKTDFNQKFIDFAKKKLIRLMPVMIFSILLYWPLSKLLPIDYLKYDNMFVFFNLQNCGLTFRHANNFCTWFVSSLFWGMCFYFYFRKCINEKMFNLITACIIFFCYGFWLHCKGANFHNINYVFNIGMLRAFAGLGIGYFISMIYKDNLEYFKNLSLNIYQKIILTAGEIYLFCFVFRYTCLHKMNYDNPLLLILAFIGLFILFIIKKGYFSKILENNFSVFLGQFSYSIFITHFVVKDVWKYTICTNYSKWVIVHPELNLILLYISILCFGVLTYYFVEKPCTKLLRKAAG